MQNGFMPPQDNPAEKVIACCSAIPTSKNLSGNLDWKSLRDGSTAMPEWTTTIDLSLSASATRASTRTSLNVLGLLFMDFKSDTKGHDFEVPVQRQIENILITKKIYNYSLDIRFQFMFVCAHVVHTHIVTSNIMSGIETLPCSIL